MLHDGWWGCVVDGELENGLFINVNRWDIASCYVHVGC